MLDEYSRQVRRRLPGLLPALSSVRDPRKRKDYGMEELLMGGIGMFLLKQDSRNSMDNKRMEGAFAANYEHHFGLRLPHQDTVADVLCEIDPDELELVKSKQMSRLFEQKWLRQYRMPGNYYAVAVDATGVVSYSYPHCEHCVTKVSKKGKTTWFHYVLEAKLVTRDGYCLSLGSEWVENPTGEYNKQDCESKAFVRLAAKLKKNYPRLPICILADGLYPNNTVFDVCEKNDWKYLIVLQDKQLKSVQEEVDIIRLKNPKKENYMVKDGWRIKSQYWFHTDIPYQNHKVHWLRCVEKRKRDVKPGQKTGEKETHQFEYITNIEPSNKTILSLCFHARLRWKIENEGFNIQKNRGYELEHKFIRNSYPGLKNCHVLRQIAHLINQLVEHGKLVKALLERHSKETIKNIWSNLVAYMTMIMPNTYRCNSAPPS